MTSVLARREFARGEAAAGEVARLFVALVITMVALDLVLSAGLGLFFDLGFVCLCVGAGLAVRPHEFFTVGVLPPLTMLLVVALVAIGDPAAVADAEDGFVQATVTGLSRHAIALVLGYGACLGLLSLRHSAATDPQGPDQARKRSGSPAP
ncbi:DUF6542 domain-containing protein [Nocardioides caeni]|uniref:DUF6542 domain-containing protein n=1 Tax=Nocardioides caeni TaxID=574700 RepID=A0A4S8NAR4_9ACTN|nr:DUF6542 domain-containing protein [Nocardioides caeni]THV12034.1 hypothetical protein E9934_11750 [Nocardioides caeni]